MKREKNSWLFASLIVFSGVALGWGCKKVTLNDALPVMKMTSVQVLGSDSVIVTGKIISNSGNDVMYEGFCYGTDPVPPITENQVLYNTDSTTFSAHIRVKNDSTTSTFYFRCFAANSFGYAVSSPIK